MAVDVRVFSTAMGVVNENGARRRKDPADE
jgi:hypothetical protein